jgi:hypothetical protein
VGWIVCGVNWSLSLSLEVLESVVPEWLNHHRESWVWCMDRFVPYPFQNNIHRLPNTEMLECLEGVIKAKENPALQVLFFSLVSSLAGSSDIGELNPPLISFIALVCLIWFIAGNEAKDLPGLD